MERFKQNYITFLLFLLICILVRCIGGSGSNHATPTPPVAVFGDFVLEVIMTPPSTASSSSQSQHQRISTVSLVEDQFRLEETRNTVSQISFIKEGESAEQAQLAFPETFVIKLISQGELTEEAIPSFPIIRLPFGSYEAFELRFNRLEENLVPIEFLTDPLSDLLLGQSFVIEGSFREAPNNDIDDDGQVSFIPFRLISDEEVKITVTLEEPYEVRPDRVNFFFIAIDLESWLAALLPGLQQLDSSALVNGRIEITKDSLIQLIQDTLDGFIDQVPESIKGAPSLEDLLGILGLNEALFTEEEAEPASLFPGLL